MPPTLSPKITITTLTPALVESASKLLSSAFAADAFCRCHRLLQDGLPNEAVVERESWMKMWRDNVRTKVEAGAEIVQVEDWTALALWFPPGVKKSTFDRSTSPAPLLEYVDRFEVIKEKYLHGRMYWYLNLIARDPEKREKGVITALFQPYLERAKREGIPVWLEATSQHSRDVYLRYGFKTVEEVCIGKGQVSSDGNIIKGGEGFMVYGMIIEP